MGRIRKGRIKFDLVGRGAVEGSYAALIFFVRLYMRYEVISWIFVSYTFY
jgi:hypothetical protein